MNAFVICAVLLTASPQDAPPLPPLDGTVATEGIDLPPVVIEDGGKAMPMESYEFDSACSSCGSCGGCGCGFWAKRCLPSPHHAPGNHFPRSLFDASPRTYYYFRPYNYPHVTQQVEMGMQMGIEPVYQPYSNEIFQRVYDEIEAQNP